MLSIDHPKFSHVPPKFSRDASFKNPFDYISTNVFDLNTEKIDPNSKIIDRAHTFKSVQKDLF